MALALAWSAVSSQQRLIYPMAESEIIVPEFPIPDSWLRAYGLDIRWNTVAVIWGARDPHSDVLYLYAEYLAESDPAIHAVAIRSRGDWIPGLIDPAANGRTPEDGSRLIRAYRDRGLLLNCVDNPVESGILEIGQRLRSGRLKVFASLTKFREERRLYRRDERDQIVRQRDHLQDALRCLMNSRSQMQSKPKPPAPPRPTREYRGEHGWML